MYTRAKNTIESFSPLPSFGKEFGEQARLRVVVYSLSGGGAHLLDIVFIKQFLHACIINHGVIRPSRRLGFLAPSNRKVIRQARCGAFGRG